LVKIVCPNINEYVCNDVNNNFDAFKTEVLILKLFTNLKEEISEKTWCRIEGWLSFGGVQNKEN